MVENFAIVSYANILAKGVSVVKVFLQTFPLQVG